MSPELNQRVFSASPSARGDVLVSTAHVSGASDTLPSAVPALSYPRTPCETSPTLSQTRTALRPGRPCGTSAGRTGCLFPQKLAIAAWSSSRSDHSKHPTLKIGHSRTTASKVRPQLRPRERAPPPYGDNHGSVPRRGSVSDRCLSPMASPHRCHTRCSSGYPVAPRGCKMAF